MEDGAENFLLHKPQVKQFSMIDYYSFGGMLAISVIIGIYFGFFGNKQNTKNEYLMGGRTMKIIPIAISLIASHTSGTALLAAPADVYKYGVNYVFLCISIVLACLGCSYIFMPVFHNLQLTSSYEYLNIRFNSTIRSLASFLYSLFVLVQCPIVIYVPSLAFSQGTGLDVHLVALVICSICIFYTTVGGIRAVVWTDTVQTIVMFASMVLVFLLGIISSGGFWNVIDISRKGHHLDLDFDIDPTVRDTFWTYLIGATVHWFNVFTVSQVTIQRLLTVPTISDARKVIGLTALGIIFVKLASVFTGLIIYAKYSNCDPLTSKQIKHTDELLPYYVIDVAGHIPGLSGLFISGILGAALSTLSGILNTIAATVYEDFISPFVAKDITEKRIGYILKLIVVIGGIIFTGSVFIIEHLGGILPLAISFSGMTGGALLGLFALGILFPISNAKGALCGGISGLLFALTIVLGNQWYKHQNYYLDPIKPLSVSGCTFPVNITLKTQTNLSNDQAFYLFRVSFWYHTMMGTAVTIIIGLIVSFCTKEDNAQVDPALLSPVTNYFMGKQINTEESSKKYLTVDKALELVVDNKN